MASQVKNGKAFEYALLLALVEQLESITQVSVIETSALSVAKRFFDDFDSTEQNNFIKSAQNAISFLREIEPPLSNSIADDDILEIRLASDAEGQTGDVRDVLTIRSKQSWEIGISAKNNHRAVKHPRLSNTIDFGEKWLGLPCSDQYFADIRPIFDHLKAIKNDDKTAKWVDSFDNIGADVYRPILEAFKTELLRLNAQHPSILAERLVTYLIGNKDFYKVIGGKKKVEILAFNLHGTLGKSIAGIRPKAPITKIKLPTRLIECDFKPNSQNTLLAVLDEGWQISFRIHNASSKVEPSLKFDVNLIGAPYTLVPNQIFID